MAEETAGLDSRIHPQLEAFSPAEGGRGDHDGRDKYRVAPHTSSNTMRTFIQRVGQEIRVLFSSSISAEGRDEVEGYER